MAGHSHWAKIKRAKGANDAKRGKIWSKIARKITIAAKNGGDPRDNLNLRYTIDEAKAVNMPRDTIEKAIKKGTGELGAENYEDATYEGYAPAGVAPSRSSAMMTGSGCGLGCCTSSAPTMTSNVSVRPRTFRPRSAPLRILLVTSPSRLP